MPSFYHSQPIYTVYPAGYSPRRSSYSSYPSSTLPLAEPEMRYRHALAEYLSAEEEYKALLRAREESRLRARVEEALRRQKWARLLQAEIVRPRREPQVRELELALAKTLSRAVASKDRRSFRVIRKISDRPVIDSLVAHHLHVNAPRAGEAGAEKESPPELLRDSSAVEASAGDKHYAKANTGDNEPPCFTSERVEHTVPNLESLLRERLQKIVGDEEVQDVARAILRHLAPVTGISRSPASASAPSTRENTCSMQAPEGADLYRSDALQGTAAEAVKESFKAHRAEVAERDKSPATSPSPLNVIQDIRSALTRHSSGFTFPPSLDFSDDEPDGLAYTPTNAPVRVYEHALDNLLAQLDAVETDGDEEVRVVRRAAVKEVEKAIVDVERRISEARESAKPGSDVSAGAPTEGDLAEDKDEQVTHAGASVDDCNKPEVDAYSPLMSKDSLDLVPSSPELSSLQNSEVVLPRDATPVNSEPKPDGGVLRDQPCSSVESIPQTAAMTTLSVATSDPTDDCQESRHEASADQVRTDRTTSALELSSSANPLESPTTVILGAIAPSSTPVSHVLPSPVIPGDVFVAFDHARLSLSQGPEMGDDSISVDVDDEREWIEVEA